MLFEILHVIRYQTNSKRGIISNHWETLDNKEINSSSWQTSTKGCIAVWRPIKVTSVKLWACWWKSDARWLPSIENMVCKRRKKQQFIAYYTNAMSIIYSPWRQGRGTYCYSQIIWDRNFQLFGGLSVVSVTKSKMKRYFIIPWLKHVNVTMVRTWLDFITRIITSKVDLCTRGASVSVFPESACSLSSDVRWSAAKL